MKMDRMGIDPVVRDLPDLGAVGQGGGAGHYGNLKLGRVIDRFGRQVGETVQHEKRVQRRRVRELHGQVAAHAAVDRVEGSTHLVMYTLGLHRCHHLLAGQGHEVERVVVDLRDPLPGKIARKVGAGVGVRVGGLAHYNRLLGPFEKCFYRGRIERGNRRLGGELQLKVGPVEAVGSIGADRRADDDLHHGPSVGGVAYQGTAAVFPDSGGQVEDAAGAVTAGLPLVRGAGEVIVSGNPGGPGGRRVVVKDQGLAGILTEIDDDVGALCGAQGKPHQVDRADPECGGIGIIGDRLRIDLHRLGEEAPLARYLQEARSQEGGVGYSAIPTVDGPGSRPVELFCQVPGCRQHLHFGLVGAVAGQEPGIRAQLRRVRLVEGEVPEAVARGVQYPEAIGARVHGERGEHGAVHHGGILESLHPHGYVGGSGNHGRLPRGLALGQDHRVGAAAIRVVVRVGYRPLLDGGCRVEPGAVHPAAEGVHPAKACRQGLGGHVDMRQPEVAGHRRPYPVQQRAAAPVPERVGDADFGSHYPRYGMGGRRRVDKGLVLDDERNLVRRDDAAGNQVLLELVGDQVTGGLAGIDVQPCDAEGVVVIEHQPGALLVGVVIGRGTVAGIGHVGDVLQTDTLGERCDLTGRGDPLVRGTVADPGSAAAMQMEVGTVLGVARAGVGLDGIVAIGACAAGGAGIGRPAAGAHHGAVDRDKEVAGRADRELVGELDAYRAIPFRDDAGAEVADRIGIDAGACGRVGGRTGMLVGAAFVLAREGAGREVAAAVNLHVAAQKRAGQGEVRVQALLELHQFDLVIVRTGIAGDVGLGHGEVLPKVVRLEATKPRQRVDEFCQRRAVGPVGSGVVIGSGREALGVKGSGRDGGDDPRCGRKRCGQDTDQGQHQPEPEPVQRSTLHICSPW